MTRHKDDAAQRAAVQSWRAARRLPRHVALADGDNELAIDLDNVLTVEAFLHAVKGRAAARLTELFPPADELCVRGPEGSFVHEIVVPFVKKLDVAKRELNLKVSEQELQKRKAAWKQPPRKYERSYGAIFSSHVKQADEGCDFDFLEGTAPTPDPEIH